MKNINTIEYNKALEVLRSGGTILYPTDTIWGIGCDATNVEAVSKIYTIKKRSESKALISLVANKRQLRNYTNNIPDQATNNQPTTIIYNNVKGLASNLIAKDKSAGIRIVQDIFCQKLIKRFGKPIISTSANISNEIPPKEFAEISEEIINNVDYIVDLRKTEIMEKASTILYVETNGKIKVLRP